MNFTNCQFGLLSACVLSLCAFTCDAAEKNGADASQKKAKCCYDTDKCLPKDTFPPNRASLYGEFIYLQTIVDDLRFAEKVPQTVNLTPRGSPIVQKNSYDPAVRLGFDVSLGDHWEIGAQWMYVNVVPKSAHAADSNYGIFASLASNVFGAGGNSYTNSVSGRWHMNMNVVNITLDKALCVGDVLQLRLEAGAQAAFLHQHMHVNYGTFRIDNANASTPRTIRGHTDTWGVGPIIGLETRLLAVKWLDIFILGQYSPMIGFFDYSTAYSDLTNAPAGAKITLHSNNRKMFSMWLLKAAAAKRFDITNSASFDVMIGWETQLWQRQVRMDFFNTISGARYDSDITLNGPFIRLSANF